MWPGGGPVQEWDGRSFSNNTGHLDGDRFFDNPDDCFRIVNVGSSVAVGSQVRLFEKYNYLMESELARRIGRPVEVISIGRNNGDVAACFPRVRDLAVKFRPDVILIEHSAYLMLQLHPELLRRMHGYDHTHTHLSNFFYKEDGRLAFRPWSKDWPLHVGKPDTTPLTKGIAFFDTLSVPMENMHPWGKETYQYLADIMKFYAEALPDQKIVLHTGMDQIHAHGRYDRTAALADGNPIPVGAPVFLANMKELSRRRGFLCLHPEFPEGFNDKLETYLTYEHDSHYSPRGHQWIAQQLVEGVIDLLKLQETSETQPPVTPRVTRTDDAGDAK